MTPDQVRALSTPELVALYNKLTSKSIKKFSSRAAGEKQVLKILAAKPAAPAASTLPQGTTRTVSGNSGGKNGRPRASFILVLTEEKAKSKPHKESDRAKLIEWLKGREPFQYSGERLTHACRIEDAEKHFQRRMRGVAQKLLEKNWLRRIEVE